MIRSDSFLHIQTPQGRSLGFSVLISPPTNLTQLRNEKGDLMCWFAMTRCNKADKHFNKKLARAALREKAQEHVRVRDLPALLSRAEARCYLGKNWPKSMRDEQADRYNFVLRKFV